MMHYSNMRYRHAMLGDLVKTSQHKDAIVSMVIRIDSLNEQVYIVPMDMSYPGEWVSGNALWLVPNVGVK